MSSIERPLPELMPIVAHEDPPPPAPPKSTAAEPVPVEAELPADPPAKRAAYKIWFHTLTSKERHAITRYCRMNPVDPERECGGIGPLHVAPPPPLMPRSHDPAEPDEDNVATDEFNSPSQLSRHDWYLSLTNTERAWVDRTCEAQANYNSGELCTFMTPLVLSFDGGAVQYTHEVSFFATATDWPTAATPWLAIARPASPGEAAPPNGGAESIARPASPGEAAPPNGGAESIARDRTITSAELFGSATPVTGGFASDGFVALAALDANHDGVIDANDPMFAKLVLWRDRDGDARASASELEPAGAMIISISLSTTVIHRCDARNNCEGLVSTMIWRDAHGDRHEGSVIDVYLPPR